MNRNLDVHIFSFLAACNKLMANFFVYAFAPGRVYINASAEI